MTVSEPRPDQSVARCECRHWHFNALLTLLCHLCSQRRSAVWAATAQADPLIVGNHSAFGGGPIQTWDFATGGATVGSFVPTGASDSNNGRGVAVLGNKVYYTELSNGFGPTPSIEVAPFNGGAGGADITTLPNPRPGFGVRTRTLLMRRSTP
jgi:hypothetical protein